MNLESKLYLYCSRGRRLISSRIMNNGIISFQSTATRYRFKEFDAPGSGVTEPGSGLSGLYSQLIQPVL